MNHGSHRIKTLGVSLLAAFALTAAGAATAQAGEFKLGATTFTAKALASETIAGSIALVKFLVTGYTIHCTDGEVRPGSTVLLGGTAHLVFLYLGCTVENNPKCKVVNAESEKEAKEEKENEVGFIEVSGLGLLLLMGTPTVKHYLLIEEGTAGGMSIPLAKVYIVGLNCALQIQNEIKGSTVVELPKALDAGGIQNQPFVTLSQMELETLFPTDKLTYSKNPLWIDGGNASVRLSGAKNNAAWGAE